MTYTLDANVLITAWNNSYPMSVFPTLWARLGSNLLKEHILFINPDYNEIDPIPSHHQQLPVEILRERYPLRTWLESQRYEVQDLNDQQEQRALSLENRYQTQENSKGASSVDIKLNSFAELTNNTIVTLEAMQVQRPSEMKKYKIPAICEEENIRCINFIQLLQETNIVI